MTEIFRSLTCISVSISVVVVYEFHEMLPLGNRVKVHDEISLYYFLQLHVNLQFDLKINSQSF